MKYFTIDEMCYSSTAKRLGINNEPPAEIKAHLKELIETILDPLRKAWGSAIVVNSGYRSEELNVAVGGSKTSAHCLGYAADLHPVKFNNKKFLEFVIKFLKEKDIPFDQVINEYPDKKGNPSWIHIGLKNRAGQSRKQIKTIS
jgi:zinc D-Ala-D-Ala carboxypeptidase